MAWAGETLAFAGHTDVVPPGDADRGSIRRLNRPFVTACYSGAARRYERLAGGDGGSSRAFCRTHPNHTGRLAFLITSDEEASATTVR